MQVMPAAICADKRRNYVSRASDNPVACGPEKPMPSRDPRFNTPAEMWVRFVFASRYVFFFASLVFSAFAVSEGSGHDAFKALVCLAAMLAGHQWLKKRGKLPECHRALEAMFRGEVRPDADGGLESLLQRRAALEEKRGQPGFDPWAVQALRREISDYVREHPESTGGLR